MSARSFRERIRAYMTGCTVEEADTLLDGGREETLAEVTAWLIKKSREFPRNKQGRAQADTAASLASQIARGAVRPNNLCMFPEPHFFEVGRTYRAKAWTFHVDAISPHPTTGVVHAIGWMTHPDQSPHVGRLNATDWDHGAWVEVTEEVAR